jgi:hypothetical protein
MRILISNLIDVGTVSIGASFLVAIALSGRAQAQQSETAAITLETIVDKWKERQHETESFDFICDGEHFEIGEMAAPMVENESGEKAPDDISHRHRRFLIDSRGRIRVEEEGRQWDGKMKMYVLNRSVDIFDGKGRKTFSDGGNLGFPSYFHGEGKRVLPFGKDLRDSPLRMAYRPFDRELGDFDASTLVLSDERATIDQRRVLVLKSGDTTVFVDPTMDFLPVKRTDLRQGAIYRVTEISYRTDARLGWVPIAWTTNLLRPDGKSNWNDNVSVTKFSINKPVADSDFEVVLPVGTWVQDGVTKESYILRANGEKRTVKLGEYNSNNYQQLLESDPKKK